MEAEANTGEERFEEIMKKWLQAKDRSVPQELQDLLQEQRAACSAMIDEKDKLIREFQEELKAKDDQYIKYLKKQAEDVDLILERLEEQTRTLLKAYNTELEQIERAFTKERKQLVDRQQADWEETMKERNGTEGDYLEEREKRIERNEAQLQYLRVRNAEEFNQIKIKLETDIQILQQQIQQMKATFQLNAEKLEYNFQVLKKRDEENTVTISQQKRKLTRMQDSLNTLRAKVKKQEKAQQDELTALMDDYRRGTEQYRDMQKKFKHFSLTDSKRFQDIWRMSEEQVRALAGEVLDADRAVHEQQLGLKWEAPPPVESPVLHVSHAPRKVSQATLYASQVLSEAGSSSNEGEAAAVEPESGGEPSPLLVKQVLELLCEEATFLVEAKLMQLLAPLGKDEQVLMMLDSIFKALGIETEQDIHHLVKHFLQMDTAEKEGQESSEGGGANLALIHSTDVPQALRDFVEIRRAGGAGKTVPTAPSSCGAASGPREQQLKALLDGSFWQQLGGALPRSHERVWEALLEGLGRYHASLQARSRLLQHSEALQQQNRELRLLLQQYMQAKINHQLEVPPTLSVSGPT